MFRRILIANRGEIALRVMRACQELGIETVCVFSEADRDAPYLQMADRTVCLGPGPSGRSYLDMEAILQAASQTEAKAIHPGYGFLAENPLFAELCRQYQFTFVGPPPSVIRLLGRKATARRSMRRLGIPVIPGSDGLIGTVEEALETAERIGYPVLLKATAGGGGKGMRLCRNEKELPAAFEEASAEARSAFGNASLYLERYIERGRHIEFQFIADAYGGAVHLGERECSIQRNHQKLIEESPATCIDRETRDRMGSLVARSVAAIGYLGAGTMEFLRDASGELYFMEVNTRLQVEHPVTEMVTGVDLVKEQIRVAANHPLSLQQEEVKLQGHAIECRVNAEDPASDFKPSPGLIARFERPQGEGVRVDSHVEAPYRVPVYYDSLVAKLIAHGKDRQEARGRMAAALADFQVEGVATTIPLHRAIMEDPDFRAGRYDTAFIAEKSFGLSINAASRGGVDRGIEMTKLSAAEGGRDDARTQEDNHG